MPLDILKSVQLSYDYNLIPAADRDAVVQAAMEIKPRLKRATEDILAIGEQLNQVKSRLPHGQWLPWLNTEFDMGEQTARNFMSVAQRFNGKSQIIGDLPPTALYLLAAPSTPDAVVEDVTAKAAAGERVRVADVKQAISAAKPTASVDDLTRHIGSWLSQQTGRPIDLLTSAAVRSHSIRHQLELFLGRRDVTFKREDIEAAIAQVANNVVKTGAANTELRGPMPTMTHKDVEDLKARHAAPPTDNTSLSVGTGKTLAQAFDNQDYQIDEREAAAEAAIAQYQAAVTANERPLQGRSGDDLIKQYETDGWKVNRTDDGWQAIHHHDQVATPKCGNVAELLDALDDGNFAEEFYFLDEEEPLSVIVARFRRNLDTASHYLTLAEEGMVQIRKRHDASAVDMGLRTTRKWLDQTIGGGEVIAKYTANK